jgi:hypothetical protein
VGSSQALEVTDQRTAGSPTTAVATA